MLRILTALILSATFASVGLAGGHKDKKVAKKDKKTMTAPKDAAHGETPKTEGTEMPKTEKPADGAHTEEGHE